MNELDSLVENAQTLFAQAQTPNDLENAKAQFLGRSGKMTELMKGMAQLSVEEKKSRGAAINVAKQAIEAALTARRKALADAELQAHLTELHKEQFSFRMQKATGQLAKTHDIRRVRREIARVNMLLGQKK